MDIDIVALNAGITILTGDRGSGKTRTCQRWADQARQAGWKIAGLCCPAVFEQGEKTAIDVVNLKSGERRRLANRADRQTGFDVTDHWDFSAEVMDWCNEILGKIEPCDLLIIDELGPLEFVRHQGWVNAFRALQEVSYQKAVVVIRPELINEATSLWPDAGTVNIDA